MNQSRKIINFQKARCFLVKSVMVSMCPVHRVWHYFSSDSPLQTGIQCYLIIRCPQPFSFISSSVASQTLPYLFILRVADGSFYAISVIPFRFTFCTAAKQCTCFHILYDFNPALAAYWTPFYFVSIIIAFHYITASMNSNLSNCSTYWYLIIFLLQL